MGSSDESEDDFVLDPLLNVPEIPKSVDTIDPIEMICQFMTKHQTNTKKFLIAHLRSTNESIVRRKKQWGSVKRGWQTTEEVLDAVDELVNQKPECRQKWNDWVLKKAKVIVASQSTPPQSLFINTNKIDTGLFDHDSDIKRETAVVAGMGFLHSLITHKLEHEYNSSRASRNRSGRQTVIYEGSNPELDSESDVDSDFDTSCNSGAHESHAIASRQQTVGDYVYHKSKDRVENIKNRFKTIGLSACRKSALRGLLTLAKAKSVTIKKKIKAAGAFGVFLCIDNLDMMECVHSRRIDATSKTYHGTWGYVHFVNPELLTGLDPSLCTLPVLQKILKDDCERPVDSGELLRSKAQEVQGHENLESCCY
ncbi:uncharacterized protein MELLADRAFT_113256 [Melampsora larici-populina 98AG31]|uniref:Uncharacterized protein n=1 Tax=Melampsora larici-populina (strain 98AG31 / pathotype 3-4-7) TaxID=747676 RepID=F4S996_MELLP|nr:uncharacterized protein MELLADRAFT_113256 [Melampsora larici-populina 98AG31]EGF98804.1 hypothetical protein MELLADRAFT_113256 [Melampsora larici-populina 98AG31]